MECCGDQLVKVYSTPCQRTNQWAWELFSQHPHFAIDATGPTVPPYQWRHPLRGARNAICIKKGHSHGTSNRK